MTFVDTGFLFALASKKDPDHERACARSSKASTPSGCPSS
jgi:predicted nucleic acid-binding protein